jgi:excinuclease ABC subunit A
MADTDGSPQHGWIEVLGARQHNLKNVDVRIPKRSVTVITGPSGSGKSSLAFNTLFAEGQRRFVESLSTYARQFLDRHEKPDCDDIRGLTPTIAIEQKNQTKNSRSTVGTATELYDYLRLLFAKLGTMYSPKTGEPVKKDIARDVVTDILKKHGGRRAYVTFPVEFSQKSKVQDRKRLLATYLERGFTRAFLEDDVNEGKEVEALDLQEQILSKSPKLTGRAGKAQRLLVMADRLSLDAESSGRFEDAVIVAYAEGFGRARVLVIDDDSKLLLLGRYAEYPSTGGGEERYPELSPVLFSFNSPLGACETCKGFGNILRVDPNLVIPNPRLSIAQGAIDPFTKPSAKDALRGLLTFCREQKISLNLPWEALPEKDQAKVWEQVEEHFTEMEADRYKMQVRVFLSRYRSPRTCTTCKGHRLRLEARHVLFHGKSIGELTAFTVEQLAKWFRETPFSKVERDTAKDILPQVESRLDFLLRVGLEYLTLDRLAKTLSGGEAQRIALANQLGSRLTQTTYVLDEPSIGLHPRDTERLIGIMGDLAALRNTVVVVEHDPDIIKAADYLVDVGPAAGEGGGTILYQGEFKAFSKSAPKESTTAAFLAGRQAIPVPMRRRMDRFKDRSKPVGWLELSGCAENNLKKVALRIPKGMFTCVTGVSGSGKSSAVRRTLYPALAKIFLQEAGDVGRFEKIGGLDGIKSVVLVDQEPIGRSPRSNPVTFMKAFDEIRMLLASTEEARKKGWHPGTFSFNVPGGRCDTCEGDGYVRVEMVFMEDMFILCDACEGKRFKRDVLGIRFKGKNVDDILKMTVTEAKRFFGTELRLHHTLSTLENVGLGYLRLGQPANTLSGGESQRLKIARELAGPMQSGIVYVLDEPTTGLHFGDVKVLLRVLHELVERGNTVVVIEHNVDVMKSSDWIVDFGPEGGERGGKIVAEGTPEDVAAAGKGHTWRFLKAALESSPKVSVPELLEGPQL